MLSWPDQRTEEICAALRAAGHASAVRRRSGLPLDPMFSASKARWLLDRLPNGQARAKAGEICIGTIDAFLLSRFGGEAVIEAGNASRTQLFDVVGRNGMRSSCRSSTCRSLRCPASSLPPVRFRRPAASEPFRGWDARGRGARELHSALFAHGAFAPGPVKATQGTGSSAMGLVERSAIRDGEAGAPVVCLTLAWRVDSPMRPSRATSEARAQRSIWAARLLESPRRSWPNWPRRRQFARRPSRPGLRRPGRPMVGRQRRGDGDRLFLRRDPRAAGPRRAELDRPPDR